MTSAYNISGRANLTRNVLRTLFIAAAAIGGFFVLAASAAFAFFIAIGLFLFGLITFGFLWARAKLFGKPFGPKAHFEKARADMEASFKSGETMDGPIIDAHRTPDGWSVDE